jgi:hypothetical protein
MAQMVKINFFRVTGKAWDRKVCNKKGIQASFFPAA